MTYALVISIRVETVIKVEVMLFYVLCQVKFLPNVKKWVKKRWLECLGHLLQFLNN